MKKQKNRILQTLTLNQLLASDDQSMHALTAKVQGASEHERRELDADRLARREMWTEAIDAYGSLKNPSWRTREKLAWCLFQQGELPRAIAEFSSGPPRQSAIANCVHIYCLLDGRQWVSEELRPRVRQLMVAALSEGEDAPIAAFVILNMLYGETNEDAQDRQVWITRALAAHPRALPVLEAYSRLALACPAVASAEIISLLDDVITPDTDPPFVWLAYRLALRLRSHSADKWLGFLQRRTDALNNGWLTLAVAQEQAVLQNWQAADDLYLDVARGPQVRASVADWTLIAFAARGRLSLALGQGDQAAVRQRAIEFATSMRQLPVEWRYPGSEVMSGAAQPFSIDGAWLSYESRFDLLSYRDRMLDATDEDNSRGFLRLLWAQCERDEDGNFTTSALEQVDLAGQELDDPILCEARFEVAVQRGNWVQAGETLTRFEMFRLPNEALLGELGHAEILDGANKTTVRNFVKGFRAAVQGVVDDAKLRAAHGLYEQVLRPALLRHKLYAEMLELLDEITTRADIDTHFDRGLANDYLGRHDLARLAYWRSAPNLSAGAISNLLRLASIQRDGAEMERLEQLVSQRCASLEGKALEAFEALAREISASRLKLANDPAVIKKSKIATELAQYPDSVLVSGITDLSFGEAAMLISLFRLCGGLDQDLVLEPFASSETPLVPVPHDSQDVFGLMAMGLIAVSPETPDVAFVTHDDAVAYLFNQVRWAVRPETLSIVTDIEQAAASGKWPDHWFAQAPDVVLSFGVDECLEYLMHCAEERGMQAPQGEKTRFTIANVLRSHSVSQAYSLIWTAAAQAVDYLVRSKVPKAQAANSIVGRIQTRSDRAVAEGWAVKRFSRSPKYPRTQMSHTLFDFFLRIGDRGFHESLAEIILPNGSSLLPPADAGGSWLSE
ncbi:lipopolysaccharide assembly protein LapB [Paraburkholderia sp. BL25I1N1]|uniref:tetratricopeptide repeat protein n=1 Tax=Paraburkholderia sp. BL25I1N1 TaxID=1938804 RepID=UPI000D0718F4|nr:hypothetical protein [Paraburkholderia sp. BL25I1N1]PRY04399.1 hypothetical protein B0G73_11275 [Paraburkholderia sp. BL25I1N1]